MSKIIAQHYLRNVRCFITPFGSLAALNIKTTDIDSLNRKMGDEYLNETELAQFFKVDGSTRFFSQDREILPPSRSFNGQVRLNIFKNDGCLQPLVHACLVCVDKEDDIECMFVSL